MFRQIAQQRVCPVVRRRDHQHMSLSVAVKQCPASLRAAHQRLRGPLGMRHTLCASLCGGRGIIARALRFACPITCSATAVIRHTDSSNRIGIGACLGLGPGVAVGLGLGGNVASFMSVYLFTQREV